MTDRSSPIVAVTGASRGIGRATALLLARRGYRVIALARSREELDTLAADGAHAIIPIELDIADQPSRDRAVQAIMAATDGYGIDVLVNNAGYSQMGPMEEVTAEQLRRQFEVNVIGLHAFTRPFLPAMRHRRHGRVVNVSSAAGRISTPFMGAYSASKFALEGVSDALRVELSPFGVQVILIEPGPIKTNFGEAAARAGGPDSPYATYERRWRQTRTASDRFETPPEAVARTIVRAIEAPHPRPRYTVTLSAKAGTVARRLAPDVVLDWIFRRALG